MAWANELNITARKFICGHCGQNVASLKGWSSGGSLIYLCPFCDKPNYFEGSVQVPGPTPGNEVSSLPSDVEALYREARRSVSIAAYTASVLVSRKLLGHIAVQKGAAAGKTFVEYVEHLASSGYVPPDGKGWVDHIRKKGNEATHEIVLMQHDDANQLLLFLEMLLRFVYEFPARVPLAP
jgi:hypothetical protein